MRTFETAHTEGETILRAINYKDRTVRWFLPHYYTTLTFSNVCL